MREHDVCHIISLRILGQAVFLLTKGVTIQTYVLKYILI